MKIILQRVLKCRVLSKEQKLISEIKNGYVLLVGFERNKNVNLEKAVSKILNAKLFDKWSKNVMEMGYEIMVLSQFTLFAQFKGKKPSFHKAEDHVIAKNKFVKIIDIFKNQYLYDKVKCGVFGQQLEIELVNDGPVTIIFEYDS
ncbi:D-aminoacyl-tRNA deacylase [Dictyocoela roeselum]|nr:D-aminoacyl-tRNA deacylase [Dictyocoela roeselum]